MLKMAGRQRKTVKCQYVAISTYKTWELNPIFCRLYVCRPRYPHGHIMMSVTSVYRKVHQQPHLSEDDISYSNSICTITTDWSPSCNESIALLVWHLVLANRTNWQEGGWHRSRCKGCLECQVSLVTVMTVRQLVCLTWHRWPAQELGLPSAAACCLRLASY